MERADVEQLLSAFLAAARDGDLEALENLLHDDVRGYNDGGGQIRAARRTLVGVSNVARFALGVASIHRDDRTVRFVRVNGEPGAVVTLSGSLHVLSLQLRDGRIYRMFDVANPAKLRDDPVLRG